MEGADCRMRGVWVAAAESRGWNCEEGQRGAWWSSQLQGPEHTGPWQELGSHSGLFESKLIPSWERLFLHGGPSPNQRENLG